MTDSYYPPPRYDDPRYTPDPTASGFSGTNPAAVTPSDGMDFPGNPMYNPNGATENPYQMPQYGPSVPGYPQQPGTGHSPAVPYYPPPQNTGYPPTGYNPDGPAVSYSSGTNPTIVVETPPTGYPTGNTRPPEGESSDGSHRRDSGDAFSSSFSDKAIRHAFIRKVFGILGVQLVITGAICSLFFYFDKVKEWNEDNVWVMLAAIVAFIVLVLMLSCCDTLRRSFPLNIVCLLLFTVVTGWLLGATMARYDTDEVLMALGVTFGIVVGMMILGFQQKYDFTMMLGGLCILTMALIGFALLCLIVQSRYLNLVYAVIAAILFSFWLLVDIQMIVGGKRKYSYNPEDYILAALNVYLDVVQIIFMMLAIFGIANG